MVLRTRAGAVNRARTAFGPRLAARTCEESTAALDQSNFSAPCNSANSSSCSRCHTPARFHSSKRRQQVIPDPKPSSCGRNSHWIPVCSTNKIPHNTCRSGILFRPGYRGLRGTGRGSNGSIRCHNPSATIHGGCSPRLTARHRRSTSTRDGRPKINFVRNSKCHYATATSVIRTGRGRSAPHFVARANCERLRQVALRTSSGATPCT
jgi:hypothetical protein